MQLAARSLWIIAFGCLALVAFIGISSLLPPVASKLKSRSQAKALSKIREYRLPFLDFGGEWASCSEEQLLEWGRKRGIRHDKLELGTFKFENPASDEHHWMDRIAERRGMRAKADIDAGEAIVTIPHKTLITKDTAAAIPNLKRLLETESLDDSDAMVLFVLHEMRNPNSEFAPVICKFPRTYELSLYWTRTDLNRLIEGLPNREEIRKMDPDIVRGMALNSRYQIVHMYNMHFPGLAEKYPEAFPNGSPALEEFVWAVSSVFSRNWMLRVNDTYMNVMGVIADMANHRSTDHGYVESVDGVFTMRAGRGYKKGEEVFTNYGPKCNEELLINYGFTDLMNTMDCESAQRIISEATARKEKKLKELKDGVAAVDSSAE